LEVQLGLAEALVGGRIDWLCAGAAAEALATVAGGGRAANARMAVSGGEGGEAAGLAQLARFVGHDGGIGDAWKVRAVAAHCLAIVRERCVDDSGGKARQRMSFSHITNVVKVMLQGCILFVCCSGCCCCCSSCCFC